MQPLRQPGEQKDAVTAPADGKVQAGQERVRESSQPGLKEGKREHLAACELQRKFEGAFEIIAASHARQSALQIASHGLSPPVGLDDLTVGVDVLLWEGEVRVVCQVQFFRFRA